MCVTLGSLAPKVWNMKKKLHQTKLRPIAAESSNCQIMNSWKEKCKKYNNKKRTRLKKNNNVPYSRKLTLFVILWCSLLFYQLRALNWPFLSIKSSTRGRPRDENIVRRPQNRTYYYYSIKRKKTKAWNSIVVVGNSGGNYSFISR